MRKVRVVAPSFEQEDLVWMKKGEPFLMRGNLESDALYLGTVPLPSIGDILGVAMGPGLPSFAFLSAEDADEVETTIWFAQPGEHISGGQALSPVAIGGAVYVAVRELEERPIPEGTHVVKMKDYAIPRDFLNNIYGAMG